MNVFAVAAGIWLVSMGAADADLAVRITDGNPLDRVMIVNLSECQTLTQAHLTIDFSGSIGGLVMDTVRGGIGTKDPFPVSVLRGDIHLGAVADGAQVLDIRVARLGPEETAIVTLDLDDTSSWIFGDRVTAEGGEISGTVARLSRGAQTIEAVFHEEGATVLPFATAECDPEPKPGDPIEDLNVPIS